MAIRIDPELERQLQAAAGGNPVQAVLALSRRAQGMNTPEEVEGLAQKLLDQAQRASGEKPKRVKVFRNMDSFIVEASPKFVRSLIAQDDLLESAMANVQPQPAVGKLT
jgi:hypothetical protein